MLELPAGATQENRPPIFHAAPKSKREVRSSEPRVGPPPVAVAVLPGENGQKNFPSPPPEEARFRIFSRFARSLFFRRGSALDPPKGCHPLDSRSSLALALTLRALSSRKGNGPKLSTLNYALSTFLARPWTRPPRTCQPHCHIRPLPDASRFVQENAACRG